MKQNNSGYNTIRININELISNHESSCEVDHKIYNYHADVELDVFALSIDLWEEKSKNKQVS